MNCASLQDIANLVYEGHLNYVFDNFSLSFYWANCMLMS